MRLQGLERGIITPDLT